MQSDHQAKGCYGPGLDFKNCGKCLLLFVACWYVWIDHVSALHCFDLLS